MTEPYVRPDVQQFLGYLNRLPGPKLYELDAATARATYDATRDLTDPPIGELAVMRDLTIPGRAGDIPARLFDARETRVPGPAMVFFHGGGWVLGSIETHASFCAELARALDLPVVSVEYRLSPEHRWPAAPDDAEAAARWVAQSPAALRRHVTGLVLCGDSAGGTLAIVAAMDLRDRPAPVPVLVQAPIYPAADMGTEHPSFIEFAEGFALSRPAMLWFHDAYAADLASARGSPMAGRLDGLPPAVVMTAGLDPLRDQGRAYAAALVRAGVATVYREAEGTIHGFVTLRKAIPSAVGDVTGFCTALKAMIVEAEGRRVMEQAT